jgi:phosphoribosyl-dephospho-CoA transferase
MFAPQRQQLARLTAAAWADVRQSHAGESAVAQDCLAHWAAHDLPLVVTRQDGVALGHIALGLPAPLRWQRLRLALQVPAQALSGVADFPEMAALAPTLPAALRPAWLRLCGALADLGVAARVHGSHGWQLITGEACVREGSDIDLVLHVDRLAQADVVVALLERGLAPQPFAPRLDGELIDARGQAVAWREWQAWRAGRVGELLVKSVGGVALRPGAQALALS